MKLFQLYALFLLSIFYTTCSDIDLKNLPKPYCNLQELLPFNSHGFYMNGSWISKLFRHNQIKTVIEVGSWLGASTRHMAHLLPVDGRLYAIDTWQGSEEHFNGPNHIKNILPVLYEQFLSNIIHAQLTNKIIPIRSDSLKAVNILKNISNHFDFIYIDAAHDFQSVLNDLEAYYPFVKNNSGILCGDDWQFPDVKKAVIEFAQKNQLSVYADHNFWFYKKEDGFKECLFTKDNSDSIWKFATL